MLLAIDVGNTNTVVGIFAKAVLKADWRLETKKERTADEWGIFIKELFKYSQIEIEDIDGVVISNVVPTMTFALTKMSERYIGKTPFLVGPDIKIDLDINLENPTEIGADRIVNAVAAHHKYQGDLIIVDFGTATTFDYVSATGAYCGGIICPGVGISAEALFQRTSKLPRVDITKPARAIGRNTIECIQSGLYYGYIGMVDSLIERMEAEIGKPAVGIATGGLASLIATDSRKIKHVDDFLTLEGLRLVYEWNC